MCGITGHWNRKIDRDVLKRMTRALAHRGPDGEGFYFDDGTAVGFGHRRLKIIDLSENAAQPMSSSDDRYHIVFNGEIYNYKEVRSELESLGRKFTSASDTEVLLQAWIEWGEAALHKFNGMWAFAIWDKVSRRLVLAVDRFNVKPLYYMASGQGLCFASEFKAFWAAGSSIDISWSSESLKLALATFGDVEAEGRTVFKGISSLKAGHLLVADETGITVRQWYRLRSKPTQESELDSSQCVDRLRVLLEDSVRLRLRSDVPTSTALSGGVDSTVVTGLVGGLLPAGDKPNYQAFTQGFPGEANDETEASKIIASHAGIGHVIVDPAPAASAETIDSYLFSFESIHHDPAAAVMNLYKSQADRGIRVTLDGHGGDEVFGGYSQYLDYSFLSSPDWPTFKALMASGRMPFQTIRSGLAAAVDAFPKLRVMAGTSRFSDYSTDEFKRVKSFASNGARAPFDADLVNSILYRDFTARILPKILRNFDVSSMASGVEVRMPLLDYRIVEYVFSLPGKLKIQNGFTKYLLRRAADQISPRQILWEKKKTGFHHQLRNYFNGRTKEYVHDVLSSSSALDGLIAKQSLLRDIHAFAASQKPTSAQMTAAWKCFTAVRLSQLIGEMRGASL